VAGQEPLAKGLVSADFQTLFGWVDAARKLRVRTNADTPADAAQARSLGAEGIGLVRTEHMFFAPERILTIRQMILAEGEEQRREALAQLLVYQREDFLGIFQAMDGLPVTVRLLDPPLHEFLPREQRQQEEVARALGISEERLRLRIASLSESNPMLGHRGCRLGITNPEITEMQVRAIAEAALAATDKGKSVLAEIMVPLIGSSAELLHQRAIVERVWAETVGPRASEVPVVIGTMIEVPRAALLAGEIAKDADFFSFGTNDLTQMTMGISRDDVASFFPSYLRQGMFADDPFQTIDVAGVGQLVRQAAVAGRATRPGMKLGVCGEHGGDPRSIAFFAEVGLDYVSCSPYRVPIARLAAAQAELRRRGAGGTKLGEA
jgi:pyruvate,orthophosphate dikinase